MLPAVCDKIGFCSCAFFGKCNLICRLSLLVNLIILNYICSKVFCIIVMLWKNNISPADFILEGLIQISSVLGTQCCLFHLVSKKVQMLNFDIVLLLWKFTWFVLSSISSVDWLWTQKSLALTHLVISEAFGFKTNPVLNLCPFLPT